MRRQEVRDGAARQGLLFQPILRLAQEELDLGPRQTRGMLGGDGGVERL
jgi:hypothetical protein